MLITYFITTMVFGSYVGFWLKKQGATFPTSSMIIGTALVMPYLLPFILAGFIYTRLDEWFQFWNYEKH